MWSSIALFGSGVCGPAFTWCRTTPGMSSTSSGSSGWERRVTSSTVWPSRARASAWQRSTTFMPPASPVPGSAAGEVCMDTKQIFSPER